MPANDTISSWRKEKNMKWFNNRRVAVKVFLACLILMILMGVIALEGFLSLNKADNIFD